MKTVTHEDVDMEELGGADDARGDVRRRALRARLRAGVPAGDPGAVPFLPQNNLEDPPRGAGPTRAIARDEALLDIVPDKPNKPYDMHDVIRRVVDDGEFYEVHARLRAEHHLRLRAPGRPLRRHRREPAGGAGGRARHQRSVKAARFVRFCDAFNIPLVMFEDVPGFLPGVAQEHGGIIKHGAKLLYAFCEATVPKLTVITRKAYGGAYDVMNSKHIRGDFNLAWPTAEIAVMGPKGAVEILFRKEIGEIDDPAAATEAKIEEYREKFAHPYEAAARGYIDDMIDPRDTRARLIDALSTLERKRDRIQCTFSQCIAYLRRNDPTAGPVFNYILPVNYIEVLQLLNK